MTNATAILKRLDPEQIRTRLESIDQERRALLILLRASQYRDQRQAKPQASRQTGGQR